MNPSDPQSARSCCPVGLIASLLTWGAVFFTPAVQAWTPTIQLGVEINDNVTKSIQEEKSDIALIAALDSSTVKILSRDWQLRYGALMRTSAWQEFSGLNFAELGLHASLRRKFGLGPYAPRLDLRVQGSRQFANTQEWSGNWLRTSAALTKRFSPQWQAALIGEHEQLDAQRDVYSTDLTGITATINYDPTENWRLSLSAGYASGNNLSWCRNSWASFQGTTQWLDGIFGDDWFPYQAKGRIKTATLEFSRAIGDRSSLSLEYTGSKTYSTKAHVYRNSVIRVLFVRTF